MKWRGRRQSANVEDRRGRSPKKAVGGIGILIILGVVWLMGGNPLAVLNVMQSGQTSTVSSAQPTAEENCVG